MTLVCVCVCSLHRVQNAHKDSQQPDIIIQLCDAKWRENEVEIASVAHTR